MKQTLNYCLKVWLTSSGLTPFLYLILFQITDPKKGFNPDYHELVWYFITAIGFALACTLVPWLIMLPIVRKISRKAWSSFVKKLVIAITVQLLLTFLPMLGYIMSNHHSINDLWFYLAPALLTLVFIWVFDFEPRKPITIEGVNATVLPVEE